MQRISHHFYLVIYYSRETKKKYETECEMLKNMVVSDELQDGNATARANVAWEDLQDGAKAVLPKTFGKTGT